MYNPVSTYRIQFNKDFTFTRLRDHIKYFSILGAGTIYASPIFEAVPGSMHGYDVTDPHAINPEIGDFNEFREISSLLKSENIGWMQDIVPNHMAFNMSNHWLWDVLEKGVASEYSDYFDIDFLHPDSHGKILIPFLGIKPAEALDARELTLGWKQGSFVIRYFDFVFPLRQESIRQILIHHREHLPSDFIKILRGYDLNDDVHEKEWVVIKSKADLLYERSPDFRVQIERLLAGLNASQQTIGNYLEMQHYKLVFWRESDFRMNYRRFFTVTGLICLRMENDSVFEDYHRFIELQIREKRFDGLRVDHIDGLKKPGLYLEKLRLLCGDETYIVTEKILQKDEELISGIPVQGTSGYDFLGIVNNVFTHKENYSSLQKFYRQITGIKDDPEDIIYEKKKAILHRHMSGELENLTRLFFESAFSVYDQDVTRESMKEAIGEVLVLFPVYRLYPEYSTLVSEDTMISDILRKAEQKNPNLKKSLDLLANIFLSQTGFTAEQSENAGEFYLRCMQFTGPLMAKGVEDTVMYSYNCFICHNEVGDEPGAGGLSTPEFHERMLKRQRYLPMSMNATSTHDTKRGEDVRARLNVITEMPDEWIRNVRSWMKMNHGLRVRSGKSYIPDENEEYFIYQTLTGVLPFDGKADDTFLERLDQYLIKSLREAKTNTGWNDPDKVYEGAVLNFVRQILKPESEFMISFIPVQKRIANFGIINSLSQLMLKSICPGIPDFYQGAELWDLSMVDPDNRMPVDFKSRFDTLSELIYSKKEEPEILFQDLYFTRANGNIKLWMTHLLLEERKANPDLFIYGKYLPLNVEGRYRNHVLAFARTWNSKWYIAVIPLFLSMIPENEMREYPGFINWEDTAIVLPESAPRKWKASYGDQDLIFKEMVLLSDVMRIPCPVLLKGERDIPERSAGILAHISSIPGKYGTGDMGEEAYEFANLLCACGQRHWQILPLNPVGEGYGYSPYSSISAFAGNLMFLDPDLLVKSRLLTDTRENRYLEESNTTDFEKAIELRNQILDKAYITFINQNRPYYRKSFIDFCNRQRYWLDDYALFVILKKEFSATPWNKWPERIRNRDKNSLRKFYEKFSQEIKREKFGQYLFNKQWIGLKNYCNQNGIRLIGDMSFYVSYDSAEVWAHPKYFKLDAEKNPFSVAGVPPDFFSTTGQLWNMPVYNWKNMKADNYQWWIRRIRRNVELCDLVRFDHFRGFSEYWEVPYGETTAINGKWTQGPGNDFFETVKKEFPGMPFIAEDLGYIDYKVHKLRDDFSLPGMVVLHFAFGDNTPRSLYIPHNHLQNSIVYTGTHDNNTTKGWFQQEMNERNKKEAADYTGYPIDEGNCHEALIRMAYGSVARIAIIPVQDILGLDETARLNKPSTAERNWTWKMRKSDIDKISATELMRMSVLFGRY